MAQYGFMAFQLHYICVTKPFLNVKKKRLYFYILWVVHGNVQLIGLGWCTSSHYMPPPLLTRGRVLSAKFEDAHCSFCGPHPSPCLRASTACAMTSRRPAITIACTSKV
jgi:hypothetical protein